mmetsp:Transcript_17622/g.21947  ORF Transcript_17622/g.21947 Transcript_17622/m.21947 type:complete len:96 (-) Transcript_17622:528-815(-)
MVYVGADGNVVSKRSPWRLSIITDFIGAIFGAIQIFFQSFTNPPSRLTRNRRTPSTNYNQRRGGGGNSGSNTSRKNVRGMKNIQGANDAPCGAGG